MRHVRYFVAAVFVAILVTACGTSGKDVVKTSGTVQSRAAVTPTSASSGESSVATSAPTTAATETPTPTPEPTATPTPQPTPTPAPQVVTVESSGFGQPASSREVGWAFIVTNPNPGLAIESSQYQIAFSDANGTVLKTESGYLELLLPSETTAVSGETILPEGAVATKMDVTFSEGDASPLDVTEPFKTDKVAYFPDDYFPHVTGVISSPYTQDLKDVRVSAVAFDAQNQIIGSGYTFLSFIPAGGTSGVSMSVTSSAAPDHLALYASISALTTLQASTATPDTGEALVISKQGFGTSQDLGELGFGFIVENPNADQSYEDSLYQVTAYDDGGTVLGTDSGYINVILGGEKLGIGGEVFLPDGTTPVQITVQVLKGDASDRPSTPMFSTENAAYVADSYFPKITGIVKNLTSQQISNIRVSAIAYNGAGDIVGGGFSYLDFAPANGQAAVEVSVTLSEPPASVELYPTITILSE